ncbi:MAG: transcriptional regulator PpsR [Pseudomonadota bacterium]
MGKLPYDWVLSAFSSAADIVVHMNRAGIVNAVSLGENSRRAASFHQWEFNDFRGTLADDSIGKFETELARVATSSAGQDPSPAVELNHPLEAGQQVPVSYTFHLLPGSETIMLIGHDLSAIADVQQKFVRTQRSWEAESAKTRAALQKLRILMDRTNEAQVFIARDTGEVLEASNPAALLFGQTTRDMRGMSLAGLLGERKTSDLIDTLLARPRDVDCGARGSFVMTTESFRGMGNPIVLCELTPKGDATLPLADTGAANMRALVAATGDAIFVTDTQGTIVQANEGMLNYTQAPAENAVVGAPAAKFLGRGAVDWRIIADTLAESPRLKSHTTEIMGAFDSQVPVTLSATRFTRDGSTWYGFIVRELDLTATDDPPIDPVNMPERFKDLVGQTSLKDIVSRTTDVIEKICIEAALELTGNNRLAAAEMLSLSRQSLYVKLRKYDLLNAQPGTNND